MKGTIARAAVRTSAVLGFRLLIQAGSLLIVAKLLGPAYYGAFAAMTALAVTLGALSTFGTHLTLLRETSRSPIDAISLVPMGLATTVLCGGILLFLFLIITIAVPQVAAAVDGVTVICIGFAELIIQPLLNFPSAIQQGRGMIARSQLLLTTPLFFRVCAAAYIWNAHTPNPLHAYAIGYLISSILAVAIGFLSIRDVTWPGLGQWRLPSCSEWHDAGSYAALNLTALGPTELDKTFAAKVMKPMDAGVYAVSTRVIGAAILPVIALMLAAIPRLFQAPNRGSAPLLRHIFVSASTYGLLIGALLWLTAPIIEWLFGAKYFGITEMLRWLTIAVPGLALRMAAASSLMACGPPKTRALLEVFGMFVLTLTVTAFGGQNFPPGMPIALACSEWSMAIVGWLWIGKNFNSRNALAPTGSDRASDQ